MTFAYWMLIAVAMLPYITIARNRGKRPGTLRGAANRLALQVSDSRHGKVGILWRHVAAEQS